jgi:hypothetical protein
MRHLARLLAPALLLWPALTIAQEPSAADIMTRVGAYAAGYGEKASVIVAAETYTQNITVEGMAEPSRPIKLDAEFAIVKLQGGGWTGFRDVIEVNDEPVGDRKDRLMALLTSESATLSEATRIANESARFNIGMNRNFNTPTAALFFFLPANLDRFTFTKKGAKEIDKIKTVEIAFKETKVPTLVTTRAGNNVPLEGSLWVNVADGSVIRTRMHMEKFADQQIAPDQAAPRLTGPTNVTGNGGGRPASSGNVAGMDTRPIDSTADIEVTYRKPAGIDLWLPAQMTELYEGPIFLKNRPASGRTMTRASYSNFKQFGAAGKIVPQ